MAFILLVLLLLPLQNLLCSHSHGKNVNPRHS